ncbi:MAG: Na+:solute symporter, partial [Sphingobacterium sp.]
LLPFFKRSGSTAALLSIGGGLVTFIVIKLYGELSVAWELAGPLMTSLILYVGYALLVRRPVPEKVEQLLDSIDQE